MIKEHDIEYRITNLEIDQRYVVTWPQVVILLFILLVMWVIFYTGVLLGGAP